MIFKNIASFALASAIALGPGGSAVALIEPLPGAVPDARMDECDRDRFAFAGRQKRSVH